MKLTGELLRKALVTFYDASSMKYAGDETDSCTVYLQGESVEYTDSRSPKDSVDLFYTDMWKDEWYFADSDEPEPFCELVKEFADFEYNIDELQEVVNSLF